MTETDDLIEARQVVATRLGPLSDDFDPTADSDYWFKRAIQADVEWRLAVQQIERLHDRNMVLLCALGLLVLVVGLLLWSGG